MTTNQPDKAEQQTREVWRDSIKDNPVYIKAKEIGIFDEIEVLSLASPRSFDDSARLFGLLSHATSQLKKGG